MPGFGFCGPFYTTRTRKFNAERCVNLYPEPDQSGAAKSKVCLLGTPGKQLYATLPDAPVRALWAGDNRLFAVGGGTMYEISAGGLVTPMYSVGAATTPAIIAHNGAQMMVVSGNEVYIDGVQAQETEGGFLAAVDGCYLGGYFVALIEDSNEIRVSGLLDGATWDPAVKQQKLASHDRLVRILPNNEQLWLFGKRTIVVWQQVPDPDFPFAPVPGGQADIGLWAPWSIARLDGGVFFLGGDDRGVGCVWHLQGLTPRRVSNLAVEYAISTYQPSLDAVGHCYQEGGHSFYALSFPSAGVTWVYDATTGMWHERLRWDGTWKADRARFHAHVALDGLQSQHFVGGGDMSGNVYVQSLDIHNDDGADIVRYRSAPHVSDGDKRVFHSRLEIVMEVGAGAPGSAPVAQMHYSDDGGFTFTGYKDAALGEAGDALGRRRRVIWRRLGCSRDRVYGVSIKARVPIAIVDAHLDAEAGTS